MSKEFHLTEEQYRRLQKMEVVGQMTSGIMHDMNNALTIISAYIELEMTELDKKQSLYNTLEHIRQQTKRMVSLARRLLDFVRDKPLEMKDVNINEVILGMDKLLLPILCKDIKVEHLLAPDLKLIKADTTAIEQILLNLYINARDAMIHNGRLTIKTSNITSAETAGFAGIEPNLNGHVLIEVSDSGTGMDEDTKRRLFEPFFTTKSIGKGTGLGLAMIYDLVTRHQGIITVRSEIGQGTTFRVLLPAASQKSLPKTEELLPYARRTAKTVLIADDDYLFCEMMAYALKPEGYRILTVHNGEQILELLSKYSGRIDLIIMDMVMPKKNGYEIYQVLRKTEPDIKMVFISAYFTLESVREIFGSDEIDFIPKPFDIGTLRHKVAQALGESSNHTVHRRTDTGPAAQIPPPPPSA